MSKNNVAEILGMEVDAEPVQQVIAGYALIVDDDDPRRTCWENPDAGLALVQEGGKSIETIFMYGGENIAFCLPAQKHRLSYLHPCRSPAAQSPLYLSNPLLAVALSHQRPASDHRAQGHPARKSMLPGHGNGGLGLLLACQPLALATMQPGRLTQGKS